MISKFQIDLSPFVWFYYGQSILIAGGLRKSPNFFSLQIDPHVQNKG